VFALALVSGLSFCAAAPCSPQAPSAYDSRSLKVGIAPRPADAAADVSGVSFGLLGDRTARTRGLQLGLVYAQTDDELRGAQVAIGMNFADRTFVGAQLAGGANFASAGRGVQLALGLNVAGRMRGAQLAMVNDAEDGRGLQVGLLNTGIRIDGVRLGLSNGAEEVRGIQVGLVNGTGTIEGVQVAVVNVTRRTRGLQIGVINVCERDEGESLALLNLVEDGVHEVALYASDTMLFNVALKLGGRHLYTALLAAYHPGDGPAPDTSQMVRGSRRIGFGIGVGWHQKLRLGRVEALDIEVSGLGLRSQLDEATRNTPVLWSLRAGVKVRLFQPVGLLAGLAANAAVATGGGDADVGTGFAEAVVRSGDATGRIYPGAFVGLQM
jgi:hypothetical protein